MDSKDGKKKESIDDILSDLNGLLNKMPSILDGIRMPEMPPAETAPKREMKAAPPAYDADKTVVLQAFSNLPEGAEVPAEKTAVSEPEPRAADADKTVILEAFSGLPEGAEAPEEKQPEPAPVQIEPAQEKLVLLSLGDYMFGEEAQKEEKKTDSPVELQEVPLEPSAENTAEPAGPSLSVPELTPPAQEQLPPQEEAMQPEPDLIMPQAELSEAPQADQFSEVRSSVRPYDTTRDFGIPDIDALMQLSGTGEPSKDEPAPVENSRPEPEVAIDAAQPQAEVSGDIEPGMDELIEFERQLKAAAQPQGGDVGNNQPEEEKTEMPQPEELQPSPESEPALPGPAAEPETGFEAFTIEPSKAEEQPVQDAGETPAPEPEAEPVTQAERAAETPQIPQPVEPAIEAAQNVFSEAQPEVVAKQPSVKPAGAELDLGMQPGAQPEVQSVSQPEPLSEPQPGIQGGGIELRAQDAAAPAPETQASQGIQLEPAISLLSGQAPAAQSGDETLVVAPPPGASGEGGKTVISDAGATLGETSRSQAGDLDVLASKPVPDGIPAERVKALMFLYAAEDRALCATVMAELDSICLKSPTKPMFIKRAAVRECDPDINANFLHQSVADIGALGLICVGNIPQEKVYEMENAFSSSGGFFRHYDPSNFSHSAALDLVTDLILR